MEPKTPKIISIASGKGGVGKTFITTNLAACLVNDGNIYKVANFSLASPG